MRDCVREAFVAFTAPLEGVVRWMYADVKGLITTGIGNLIDPVQYALPLPWRLPNGTPAQRDEIAAEWLRVKNDPKSGPLGHRYSETITRLRLDDQGVNDLVARKLDQNDRHLAMRFQEWESWPADAQLATLSMAWAMGPGFRFPLLEYALRRQDWLEASVECHMSEAGNPGIVPRNKANRLLYRNAHFAEDPAVLYWPRDLESESEDEEVTMEDFPIVYARPDPPPRELTNLGDPDLDDDPPEAA